jgi:molybdenum cofactor biosynthesis protein B
MFARMAQGRHRGHDVRRVSCGVITVSDTRTQADDTSGQRIQTLLREAGHGVDSYQLLKDEPVLIRDAIFRLPTAIEAVILNGGTGLASRDTTYEAVQGLLHKEITGFGELFRMLSYEQVGAAAMLSRAIAGVAGDRVFFSVPGSTKAVELAMTKLILPEIGHVVGLIRGRR